MATITYRKKLRVSWKDELLLLAFTMFLLGPGCVKTIFEARSRNIHSRNWRRRQ